MEQSTVKRRSAESIAFERYLRTGIRLSARAGTIEVKFNPWHDPANGRFTFGGQGRYFGNGSSAAGQARGGRRQSRQEAAGDPDYSRFDPHDPRNRTIYKVKRGDSLTTIAKLRNGLTVADLVWLNGIAEDAPLQIGQKLMLPTQRYLDDGRDAKNQFIALDLYMETHGGKMPPDAAHPPSIETQLDDPREWHPVEKNGYRYELDLGERTREIKGEVSIDATAKRSRRNQREAGGQDRRATDDGGHYIAARFNGPSDAFNHFAQDANFNRGAYRVMENSWAATVRTGHRVSVDIVPHYVGLSRRPDRIAVTWTVDGKEHFRTFANESGGRHRGGR
jgi:LysM repeat protein